MSRYVRRVEQGERIAVTHRGRVVAELVPPGTSRPGAPRARYQQMVDAGLIRPAVEAGDPLEDLPSLGLPPGTAEELLAADRGER